VNRSKHPRKHPVLNRQERRAQARTAAGITHRTRDELRRQRIADLVEATTPEQVASP